jgi:hypothetical protein
VLIIVHGSMSFSGFMNWMETNIVKFIKIVKII